MCPRSDMYGNDVCRLVPAAPGTASGVREYDKRIQTPETQTVHQRRFPSLKSMLYTYIYIYVSTKVISYFTQEHFIMYKVYIDYS